MKVNFSKHQQNIGALCAKKKKKNTYRYYYTSWIMSIFVPLLQLNINNCNLCDQSFLPKTVSANIEGLFTFLGSTTWSQTFPCGHWNHSVPLPVVCGRRQSHR